MIMFENLNHNMTIMNFHILMNMAMIRCGLSLDINGHLQMSPFFPNLQEVIRKNKVYFDGKRTPTYFGQG